MVAKYGGNSLRGALTIQFATAGTEPAQMVISISYANITVQLACTSNERQKLQSVPAMVTLVPDCTLRAAKLL